MGKWESVTKGNSALSLTLTGFVITNTIPIPIEVEIAVRIERKLVRGFIVF